MSTAPGRTQPDAESLKKIKSALLRFRVMAYATGVWLLVLTAEMIIKYGFGYTDLPGWIAQVHGLFYILYLVFTLDLAIKVRWQGARIILTMLAGTVPFLSFYVEHIRTKQVRAAYAV